MDGFANVASLKVPLTHRLCIQLTGMKSCS